MEKYHGLLISDCTNFILIGDGFCNDITNNVDCGFDGGDCCGSCVNTEYCTECTCQGNFTGLGVPNPLIGDGYCNDITNNIDCSFDGGDCCGYCVATQFCTECVCLENSTGNAFFSPEQL